jgi:hypothetical protein
VPPGDHKLEFRYQPQSLKIGASISALTALLLAVLWGRQFWRQPPF